MPAENVHVARDAGPAEAGGRRARAGRDAGEAFPGFKPLDANYLYTPNQFFDLCLPNHSRGCVRLVAYLLRRTLGWLDKDGKPVEQRIGVTWRQLIDEAGISRGGITKAVDEAVAAGYVRVARHGRAKAAGVSAESARYELRWDDSGDWHGDPATFRGFYTGEGRRSPIPDAYFENIVRDEPLAVARVVGIVLRQTVGYQNQFGGRRQQAALSLSDLQRRCGIADRKTLSDAVGHAVRVGYVTRVREGVFDPDAGRLSRAAVYGVHWLDAADGPDSPPEASPRTVQKSHRRTPTRRSNFPTGPTVQKHHPRRSTTPTGDGSITRPAVSEEEKTPPKDTPKQQAADALVEVGFDPETAARVADHAGPGVVERQVAWLPGRRATVNRLGLLRRAIEGDWPEPPAPPAADGRALLFARSYYAAIAGRASADDTVAEPSHGDIAAGERVLAKLPDTDAAAAGRRLAARVRDSGQTAHASLVAAVRRAGDRLVDDLARPASAAGDDAHAEYTAYLRERMAALRASQPSDWSHFNAYRAARAGGGGPTCGTRCSAATRLMRRF